MINDWSQLVPGDFQLLNLIITDDQIIKINQTQHKPLNKQKVHAAACIEFKEQRAGHEKVKLLEHENLSKHQDYLKTNHLTNMEASLLYNLRCETVSGIRDNFHRQYPDIKCQLCLLDIYTQSHVLCCPLIKNQFKEYTSLPYEFIHGNLDEQVAITSLYSSLLEVWDRLLDEGAGIPGPHNTGLSDIIVIVFEDY